MIRALHKGRCRCCKRIEVDFPEEPKKRPPAKKDTKRWCGGHVGREHDTHWIQWMEHSTSTRLICKRCGKTLDWCGSFWSKKSDCKCGKHV
jgi:hypothetical protein